MDSAVAKTERNRRAADAKSLGAFYTDAQIADFLAWWAIRSPTDTILDPCFGGGVFVRSACERLLKVEGDPRCQVTGVEIDPQVYERVASKLQDQYSIRRSKLVLADFFSVDATPAVAFDVVIGNPPFVRYQRFQGESRQVALLRSAAHGVRLPELCSSWAPFLVHCIGMLRDGGRLAMVLPMEVAHAKYARPVLEFLGRSFLRCHLFDLSTKAFPRAE